jgi:hypothetical protein
MAARAYYWEFVATTPAVHFPSGYSLIAPTEQDSVAAGNPPTAFTVVGRNSNYSMYWASQPDSGYSVDDLAPAAPAPFVASYNGGTTRLRWEANIEPDFADYRLYRGATAGFVPSLDNRIAVLADLAFDDVGPAGSWYKLSATDLHGNESAFAVLAPSGIVGAAPMRLPTRVALLTPSPSPAQRPVTLGFQLPQAANVQLAVYDASGRRVRVLASGERGAGEHRLEWDLRDDRGARASAGLYFVRLDASGERLSKRFVTLR